MDEVFRVTDRWGRVIVLTQDRWTSHIVAGHIEFRGQSPSILADTLTAPTLVTHDRKYPDHELFYRPSPLPPPWSRLLIRVVVRFGVNGEVVTAHVIPKAHREEVRRWP